MLRSFKRSTVFYAACGLCIAQMLFFANPEDAFGFDIITSITDQIVTSAPSATTTHAITFTPGVAIPTGGKIELVPERGHFSIPSAFDINDIDLAVSSGGGPFSDRTLAAAPSATEDGVSIITGTSGSIVFTLNSTAGIGGSDEVQIELGTNATFQAASSNLIANPSAVRSYKIAITARDDLGAEIDTSNAMIAVVGPVVANATVTADPPIISNALPQGDLAAGNEVIELSLDTNELAQCRYATTTNVLYEDMTGVISETFATFHSIILSGFQDNTSYAFYVRCADFGGNANDEDTAIAFSLKETVVQGTGGSSGGGQGQISGGSQHLFLAEVSLEGRAYQDAVVEILKDGEREETLRAGSDGAFTARIIGLERGRYTFSAYATDRQGNRSASFSASLTVGQGTRNVINNVILPPTAIVSDAAPEAGEPLFMSGQAPPDWDIEISLFRQLALGVLDRPQTKVATATPSGDWEFSFDTAGLSAGTYELTAVAARGEVKSIQSRPVFVGIGEEPEPDFFTRADMNGDGNINIIDFSILLTNWNTANAAADINADGIVNLTDFSILIFNWTG